MEESRREKRNVAVEKVWEICSQEKQLSGARGTSRGDRAWRKFSSDKPTNFDVSRRTTLPLLLLQRQDKTDTSSKNGTKEGSTTCAGKCSARPTGPRGSVASTTAATSARDIRNSHTDGMNRRARLRRCTHLRLLQRHLRPRHRSFVRLTLPKPATRDNPGSAKETETSARGIGRVALYKTFSAWFIG